ncbi:cell division ATP-binding protein FtsE [Nesterenkonia sp. LB17]|uniref:cell division ATP-binding protein FtsE n=1 Tax=Nesterenkonia sp. LB17 TaxID=2901230 RepID=UPI001F4C599D|nr:cell division ATP-binding protein FtsE [Nesterenkonia sp. LB17]MCH8564720.1 cell division ATP-binding protein FtsE [Nesterenkonia sp. LB17]
MIRFEQVTRRYEADGRPALDDVTVEFYREDFAFLIGASGSGKSTLLRMILREGLPQRGKVTVAGQNLGLMLDRRVPDFRRSIGMVFQDFRLLPDKTVFDNVAFAMRVLGAKRSAIRKRVTKVLEKVDLAHLAKRYPHEISGGEQQRAAIARAIVNDPAILLADEPTGNLDPRASAEVMKVLRWINASGTTVIMATHDRAIVDQANSRVVQLHHGRVVRDEPHGSYDPPEGSEARDVLAQEEGESGLRAHDPAPLKTGMVPAVVGSDTGTAEDHLADSDFGDGGTQEHGTQEHDGQEHHTWEPDAQDHHFVESRDDAIDHVGDHPQDQVMAPGEDPSVLAYDEDPVLQETAPVAYTDELTELDLDDDAPAAPAGDDSEPGLHDAPINDEPVAHDPFEHEHEHEHEHDFDGEGSAHEEDAGFRVTWPEHLRHDAHGHDVKEPHGDFNGTEMPDLEQDGYTETEDDLEDDLVDDLVTEPADEPAGYGAREDQTELRADHQDAHALQSVEPTLEEPITGEIPAATGPSVEPPREPDQPRPPSAPMFDGEPLAPLAPATPPPARPQLSWLARADDDAPQPPSAQPPEQQSPSRPAFTLDPPTPDPEPEPEPEVGPQSEPELEREPELPPEPEEPSPVPQPESSAAQSTYPDASRTAEHLGLSRSRRSIMRRLRRDR